MPKVSRPADIEQIADVLAILEGTNRPAASRVLRLQIGELDLTANLGLEVDTDEYGLLLARAGVVVASTATHIAPPVGAVWPHLSDEVGLRSSTERLRRLGFVGRAALHPRQLEMIHQVFSPSVEEVEAAPRLVADYEDAVASGRGVLLDRNGQTVDRAVVRRSRPLLNAQTARGVR